jgi:hypothetical protein
MEEEINRNLMININLLVIGGYVFYLFSGGAFAYNANNN